MSLWALLVLAVGLSVDAAAAALTKGVELDKRSLVSRSLIIAALFGFFQAAMPVLGWLLGSSFASRVAPYDHWIAFGLLAAVGGKMLWDGITGDDDGPADPGSSSVFSFKTLLVLSFATSIDALAVGVSFAFTRTNIWLAAVIIGVTTFAISFTATMLGKYIGMKFSRPATIAGGVILIVLGVRLVLEHTGII